MKLDPKIGRSLKKASPTILTCIGAVGVVATAVLAVKATPKADGLIKADSSRNHDGDPYAATKLEAVKSCWKCYIPAAATGVATIICIFGANTLNKKQQASLASAYALVNRSYSDYKRKLKELYGEDAHKKIMESIAAEKAVCRLLRLPEASPTHLWNLKMPTRNSGSFMTASPKDIFRQPSAKFCKRSITSTGIWFSERS